jgi:hypothetical protein
MEEQEEQLIYFRPGEEARMLARLQFGFEPSGRCGGTVTYPIKGYPWRRNPEKTVEFQIPPEQVSLIFREARELPEKYPEQCLGEDDLWSDHSEKANGITRDDQTDTLCHSIYIYNQSGETLLDYDLREDSPALLGSFLYKTVTRLMEPYERLESSPVGG